ERGMRNMIRRGRTTPALLRRSYSGPRLPRSAFSWGVGWSRYGTDGLGADVPRPAHVARDCTLAADAPGRVAAPGGRARAALDAGASRTGKLRRLCRAFRPGARLLPAHGLRGIPARLRDATGGPGGWPPRRGSLPPRHRRIPPRPPRDWQASRSAARGSL